MATAEYVRSGPRLGDAETQRLGCMMLDGQSSATPNIVYDPDLVRRVENPLGISEARSRLMVFAHNRQS